MKQSTEYYQTYKNKTEYKDILDMFGLGKLRLIGFTQERQGENNEKIQTSVSYKLNWIADINYNE